MKSEDARKLLDAYDLAVLHFDGDKQKAQMWLCIPNPIMDRASRTPLEMINAGQGAKVLLMMKDSTFIAPDKESIINPNVNVTLKE